MRRNGKGEFFQKEPSIFFRDRQVGHKGKISVGKTGDASPDMHRTGEHKIITEGNKRNDIMPESQTKATPELCLK